MAENFLSQIFSSQQFKRSCLPDGPKVGTVAVSPRGDLRMPSDASARVWMEELEHLDDEEQSKSQGFWVEAGKNLQPG